MTIDLSKYRKLGGRLGSVGTNGALVGLRYMNFDKEQLWELLADLQNLTPQEVRSSEYLIANIWSIPLTMRQWAPNFAPPHEANDDYWEILLGIVSHSSAAPSTLFFALNGQVSALATLG